MSPDTYSCAWCFAALKAIEGLQFFDISVPLLLVCSKMNRSGDEEPLMDPRSSMEPGRLPADGRLHPPDRHTHQRHVRRGFGWSDLRTPFLVPFGCPDFIVIVEWRGSCGLQRGQVKGSCGLLCRNKTREGTTRKRLQNHQ